MVTVKHINIFNNNFKLEVFAKGSGRNPKWLLSVNDEVYHSIVYFNFKKHNADFWNGVEENLRGGAYEMFI